LTDALDRQAAIDLRTTENSQLEVLFRPGMPKQGVEDDDLMIASSEFDCS